MTGWQQYVVPLITATSVIIVALISAVAGVLAYRSKLQENRISREQNAGTMALGLIAEQRQRIDQVETRLAVAESEVSRHTAHHRKTEEWWDEHKRWDRDVEHELDKLDPGARARLPQRTDMPRLAETPTPAR